MIEAMEHHIRNSDDDVTSFQRVLLLLLLLNARSTGPESLPKLGSGIKGDHLTLDRWFDLEHREELLWSP
jgi:hypothetical protein